MKFGYFLGAMAVSMCAALSAHAATVDSAATGSSSIGGFVMDSGTMTDVGSLPGAWVDDDATSQWVWDGDADLVETTYTFSWEFDLTGFDATSAVLDGLWATDNYGTASLNGNEIATLPFGTGSFSGLHVVAADGVPPFMAGLNELVFEITNGWVNEPSRDPGPGGFRASVTVSATPVPLPAAGFLLIAGLAGLGFFGRRKPL
ncbi:MAG: VPLPA-CTERM sorting domain-containing protein [Roseobacter sp.]|uniref:VPLPA-CTERM sorting domain-containing protein n=1 Tax=Alphaproteobacteria TaxID=28211 RepID=UPI0032638A83